MTTSFAGWIGCIIGLSQKYEMHRISVLSTKLLRRREITGGGMRNYQFGAGILTVLTVWNLNKWEAEAANGGVAGSTAME